MSYAETLDEAPDDSDGLTIEGSTEPDGKVEIPEAALPVSSLPPGRQFDVLSNWIKLDLDHSREWRAEARFSFAFRAGEQWTPEDKAILAEQSRPVIVFNRVLTILKAVAGMEINGRHEIAFIPRGTEDVKPNEVLTAGSKWMADTCDGEDEESEAFDNCCTCGMGFVEERMAYDDDPAGLYNEEAIDPLEMVWDRTAKKKNLKGARRMARIRRMSLGDAMAMFPGFTPDQLDAVWAQETGSDYPERSIEDKRRRDNENTEAYDDSCEVTIVQIQWIEREIYWLVADQATGTKAELSDKQYKTFKARMTALRMPDVPAARLVRKVYKQAFLGATGVMLKKAGPAPIKKQFTWKCITGEYDKAKGCWFGLVRLLRDPQMWANKWISQILHILNTTAKGGILAERSAFDDEREAEDGYARSDNITWMTDGALSGQKPKVMPKPGTPLTEGYVGLLAFAISSFKDVSGINLELLGQQDQNQPGVLEAMRKQAGMTVLATLFDALRNFRKQVGKTRLFFIQTYISDGRLIRVAGMNGPEAVRLAKDKTVGEYDVVVDDTPTSPNQKEANWQIIQPLLVVFKDQLIGNPQVLAMLLEYSPLPARIVDAIKQFIQQSANDPEQKQIRELAVAGQIATIEKDRSVANLNNAKAGGAKTTAIYEITMAQNLMNDNKHEEARHHLEMATAIMDAEKAAQEAEAKRTGERTKAIVDVGKLHIANRDADTRRITAVANARKAAADTHHARAGILIDHLSAMGSLHRDIAGAHKDHAAADLTRRTPAPVPGGGGA